MQKSVKFRIKRRGFGEKPPILVAYLFGPMENREDHGEKLRELICERARAEGLSISFLDPVALEYLKTGETTPQTKFRVANAIQKGDFDTVQRKMWPIKTVDLEIVRYMACLDGKNGRPKGILIGCFPRYPETERIAKIVNDFIDNPTGTLLDSWRKRHKKKPSQEEEITLLSFLRKDLGDGLKTYLFDELGQFVTTGGSSLEIGEAWRLHVPIFLVPDNDFVPEQEKVTRAEFMKRLSSKWILSNVLDLGDIFINVDELISFLKQNTESIQNGEYIDAKISEMSSWQRQVEERKLVIEI